MMKIKTVILPALLLAFSTAAFGETVPEILVTAPAEFPPPGTEMHSKTVNFADLDVTKAEGAHALFVRIAAAAKEVCAPDPGTKDQRALANYKNCVGGATGYAVVRLNNPLVTAEYMKGLQ